MMFRAAVVAMLLLFWGVSGAAERDSLFSHEYGLPALSAKYRFTYEELYLPGGEAMGLLGGNYLLGRREGSYLGLGIYGAISGDRGGFFVGGVETGYASCWLVAWCADLGLYLGGGGGGAAPQGGGLMLRPHVEMRYMPGLLAGQWGLGVSEVRFPNGEIRHQQIYISFEHAFQTLMLPGWQPEAVLQGFSAEPKRLGAVSRSLYVQTMNYFPSQGQHGRSGKMLDQPMSLVGIRWREHSIRRWSWDFETSGAFGGEVDGLAQVFGGASLYWCQQAALSCHTTLMLGSAGGGDVDSGGGMLGRLLIGAEYALDRRWRALLELGQTSALQAPFNATTLNLGVGYHYRTLVVGAGEPYDWARQGGWQSNRLRSGIQSYFAPVKQLRKQSSGGEQIDLLALKLDSFVTPKFYVSGQALGAFRGDAGGYAVGLLGAGWRQPWSSGYFTEAELGLGAGGGGGIAVGNGTLMQPMLSVGRELNRQMSLALGWGWVVAPADNLSAQVLDLSVNYRFSVPHLAH